MSDETTPSTPPTPPEPPEGAPEDGQPGYPPPPPGYPQPGQTGQTGYPPPPPGYPQPGYPQPGQAQPGYPQPGSAQPQYAQPQYGYPNPEFDPLAKSKLVAGLLGIFLGGFGIQRFYLGFNKIGVIQIIVTLLTCGIGALWGFVEGILYLVGAGGYTTDADGRPLKS